MHDQAFYDTMFALRRALVFLAGEARAERHARQEMTVRALRAEAARDLARIERDFWRSKTRREREVHQRAKKRIA